MSCMLRISGKDLDVDHFIAANGIIPHKVGYKGEPRFITKPEKGSIAFSYFNVVASKAGFDDIEQQVEDTIQFLKDHLANYKTVATDNTIKYAALDFGVNRKDGFVQEVCFPKELIMLAGKLGFGLEVSIYDTADDDEAELV